MPSPLIVTADDAPAPLQLVDEQLTILASGAQTGGYEIFHQAGPEGAGPPPHSHPWDESFYILDGEVHFGADERQDVVAKPGTLVHLPAGTVHWFRFGPGGGTMLSMTSREAASHFFTEAASKIAPDDPDLGQLVAIAATHDLEVHVPG
jgi:quercetin dioxygenase-like cupin family protein